MTNADNLYSQEIIKKIEELMDHYNVYLNSSCPQHIKTAQRKIISGFPVIYSKYHEILEQLRIAKEALHEIDAYQPGTRLGVPILKGIAQKAIIQISLVK